MNAPLQPAFPPPGGQGGRLLRGVLLALLVLAGLAVGALAGLFVAGWLGWLPPPFPC